MRRRFIKGYYKYFADIKGNIYSINFKNSTFIKLKTRIRGNGYLAVDLYKNGKKKTYFVHRLVAEAFLKRKQKNQIEVNHIDGNRINNSLENLEWITKARNLKLRRFA